MNWHYWLDWAMAHQGRWLFLIFLILGASPIVFALPAGFKLRAMTRDMEYGLFRLTAQLLMGIGLEKLCALIANIDPPFATVGAIHYPSWYAWWFWVGQFCSWFPATRLSWQIFYPKGAKPTGGSEGVDG